jgi:hypothetical protein
MKKFLIVSASALILIGALLYPAVNDIDVPIYGGVNRGLNTQTYNVTYDADTQYVGKCGIVTPPTADSCDAAQGVIRYAFFGKVVNASQFKVWKNQNPGEYARLTAHMNTPFCGSGASPDMNTFYGGFLADAVEAYACARGIEAIVWPTPNPPLDPKRADKTPPTPPTGLTVTP